jgi:hypothetical protein
MEQRKLEWHDLRWTLQVAGRASAGLAPSTTAMSDWSDWTLEHSRRTRFRGRDGWRSVGPLDSLLKEMALILQTYYQPPASVFGFVPTRSTVDAAAIHIGSESALTLDLRDFFGQITASRVRSELQSVLDEESLDVFLGCCVRGSLPLGFRTSPVISNLVFKRTDLLIEQLCLSRSVQYSRWVDDLIFSGASVDDAFLADVTDVLHSTDWKINTKKTRFMSSRRVVLGLNIAEGLDRPHVPRGMKKELRKQVYYLSKFGIEHFSHPGAWPFPRIFGMIAYVKSVDPNLAARLEEQLLELPDDPRIADYASAVGGGRWQRSLLNELGFRPSDAQLPEPAE